MNQQNISIGKIVAPHGVRGDVRVIPLTDFPDRFQSMKEIILEDGVSLTVENVNYHKEFVLLKFKGLEDKNAVEKLRGKEIRVTKDQLVKLPEGHFYTFDIIGLQVQTEDGETLGRVTDVIATGSNDVYVVEQNGKVTLVPALKQVVQRIDLAAGLMVVRLQEEWE
ncbi:MAG TPA: ribosome maturation factor RimM [Patescibacteria group bacterium]|nr:ribosome maturation factor RimM [Patescibacteria group bacterium]